MIVEGQVYPVKIRNVGASYYLLLTPDFLDYLEIKDPENAVIIVKSETSKKWGHYLGIGKDKR